MKKAISILALLFFLCIAAAIPTIQAKAAKLYIEESSEKNFFIGGTGSFSVYMRTKSGD